MKKVNKFKGVPQILVAHRKGRIALDLVKEVLDEMLLLEGGIHFAPPRRYFLRWCGKEADFCPSRFLEWPECP
jgi:hypothetical protein